MSAGRGTRITSIAIRILVALAGLAFVIVQAMRDVDALKKHTWVLVALAIVVGVATFVQNAWSAFRRIGAEERAGRTKRRQKALVAALAEIAEFDSTISFAAIGASVFAVRTRRARQGWKLVGADGLKRVERFRVTDLPQASNVDWVSGKGAIGEVLRTKATAYKHWAPMARRCKKGPLTSTEFAALTDEERSGFTHEEFMGIAAKYAEIHATPIMSEDGSKLVGVLSIDRRYEGDLSKKMNGNVVAGIAEAAAVALRADV